MEAQVATREETEAMFSKIAGFMEYIRNQLVNNTELAKKVEEMQAQINSLTEQVNNGVSVRLN